jgi:retron-type reverse transcriptase
VTAGVVSESSLDSFMRRAYLRDAIARFADHPINRILPTFEDKVAQRAIVMVLEAVYEQDFRSCSYGFRPQAELLPWNWRLTG